jgi:N-acetylglucosamine-1-phosphate uridyltransferase (contains nucleotidyltransferase and I-patch acetyltransferase domains)
MQYILFDDERYNHFLPLTHTRPVSELRCGIWTIREKWQRVFTTLPSYKTASHLQEKYPYELTNDNLFINSALIPNHELINAVLSLKYGECLVKENMLLAAKMKFEEAKQFDITLVLSNFHKTEYPHPILAIQHLWDLFSLNDIALRMDFEKIIHGKTSQKLSSTNTLIGDEQQLFIEEGAIVEASVINTTLGPVYIGEGAEVMEGCLIRGPFALGEHAMLKMGAKVYGASTVGMNCKVGGEINNVVFHSNSNKAHDGFLGNAYVGEWCNFGADSNNSNLKNNYEEVKLWNEGKGSFEKTGLQFCGLIMADHSKCGINTMFNTGTVVGVSCNVYGAGFPRNYIPSFSWGSANSMTEYQFNKAMGTAARVMARRNMVLDEREQRLLFHVFENTKMHRHYT